jgi:hypothetical protein
MICTVTPLSAAELEELTRDKVAGMRRDDVKETRFCLCIAEGLDDSDGVFQDSHGLRVSAAKVNLGCESSIANPAMDVLFSGPVQAIERHVAGAKRRPKWDGLTLAWGRISLEISPYYKRPFFAEAQCRLERFFPGFTFSGFALPVVV